jgi:hypothetical protein
MKKLLLIAIAVFGLNLVGSSQTTVTVYDTIYTSSSDTLYLDIFYGSTNGVLVSFNSGPGIDDSGFIRLYQNSTTGNLEVEAKKSYRLDDGYYFQFIDDNDNILLQTTLGAPINEVDISSLNNGVYGLRFFYEEFGGGGTYIVSERIIVIN